MAKPSGTAWAIESRGRIVLEQRFRYDDQIIGSTGGLSGPGGVEAAIRGTPRQGLIAQGGPLWRIRKHALPFLREGERVVKVRVVEVS